jgi:hypothetical protein
VSGDGAVWATSATEISGRLFFKLGSSHLVSLRQARHRPSYDAGSPVGKWTRWPIPESFGVTQCIPVARSLVVVALTGENFALVRLAFFSVRIFVGGRSSVGGLLETPAAVGSGARLSFAD